MSSVDTWRGLSGAELFENCLGQYSDIEKKVFRFIRERNLISENDRILAAVSGGSDSMALLLLLARLRTTMKFDLGMAYVDHRSTETTRRDSQLLAQVAEAISIPFFSTTLPVFRAGRSPETWWRKERYQALITLARSSGYGSIATGHTMNDQAETVYMRLLRGTGTAGLAGILPARPDGVIRPLLTCGRRELRDMLTHCSINWRDDPSNMDTAFERNRIRHHIFSSDEHIVRTLSRVALAAQTLNARIGPAVADRAIRLYLPAKSGCEIDLDFIRNQTQSIAREAIRRILVDLTGSIEGFSQEHIKRLYSLCRPARFSEIRDIHAIRVFRSYDRLFALKRQSLESSPEVLIEIREPGSFNLPGLDMTVQVKNALGTMFPLILRNRRSGDRLYKSSVKLKTFLIKQHVPVFLRDRMPLLASNNEVVWLPPPLKLPVDSVQTAVKWGERSMWKSVMGQKLHI